MLSDMSSAIRFYYSGNLEEAESILGEILQEDKYNINALVRYGTVLEDLGKELEAGQVYTRLSQLYFREKNYADCLDVLEKAIRYQPESENLPLMKGICLYRLGRYEEALPYFEEAPKEVENLFYLGKIHFALKQYSEAGKVFRSIKGRKAVRKEDAHMADYWLGKTHYAGGRFAEALTSLKSYNKAYPDERQVYLDLALCFYETGEWAEAEKKLIKYRDMGGSRRLADLNLGVVYYRKGEYEQAIEYLNSIPVDEQSLHWKGMAHYGQGMYNEAIECFTELLKLKNDPYYYKIMGSSHLKLGRYFEAKMLIERALGENPEDPDLERMLNITTHYLKESGLPGNKQL